MSIENVNRYNELIKSISSWDAEKKVGYAEFLVRCGDFKTLDEANKYIKRLDERVEALNKPTNS